MKIGRLPRRALAVLLVSMLPVIFAADEQASRRWIEIGRFDSQALCECSGLVRSRRYPDIFWAHNDSGNAAELFAVRLTGEVVARIPVDQARNTDWEDITINDQGHLFIGDLGDGFGHYRWHALYEVAEPDPTAQPVVPAKVVRTWRFQFPDHRYDCESLFYHRGFAYVITKVRRSKPVLFRLEPAQGDVLKAMKVCELPVGQATGADVSDDGTRLAVCGYGQAWVFKLPENLARLAEAKPLHVTWPGVFQTEACTFEGQDLIIAAESRQMWRVTADDIQTQRRFAPK